MEVQGRRPLAPEPGHIFAVCIGWFSSYNSLQAVGQLILHSFTIFSETSPSSQALAQSTALNLPLPESSHISNSVPPCTSDIFKFSCRFVHGTTFKRSGSLFMSPSPSCPGMEYAPKLPVKTWLTRACTCVCVCVCARACAHAHPGTHQRPVSR